MKKLITNSLVGFEKVDGANIYEIMYKRLLNERIIYLNDDVSDMTVDMVTLPIILLNEEEKDIPKNQLLPITIYLNSYGGSADACVHLIEVIEKSRIPIHCKILSMAASAGLYLALACHHRVANENSIFLLHKGSIQISGNMNEAEEIMTFYKEDVQAKFDDLILRKTKITKDELKKIRRNETYCLGREALETYGFIDELV